MSDERASADCIVDTDAWDIMIYDLPRQTVQPLTPVYENGMWWARVELPEGMVIIDLPIPAKEEP